MNRKKTLLLSFFILAAGAAVTVLIFSTEPTAAKTGASKETAMLVETIEAEKGDFRPIFHATATVQPSRQIQLSPRVQGEVVRQSPNFVPGATVEKGELLLKIDPADYENALALRQSDLMQAKADFRVEQGRQAIAQQDLQLIGDTTGMSNALVLRKPQLEAAQGRLRAAEASVSQARLNLGRTAIKAPFRAQVLSRNANVGSQVGLGSNLGRLVGIEEYWVVVTMPASSLRWLSFQGQAGQKGALVKISDRQSWKEGEYREGRLSKMVGALENQTRLARLIVSLPDPLALQPKHQGLPPLLINSFVEAKIEGKVLQGVVRLSLDYLRDNNTVWVMEDGKLNIREVDILVQDAQYAYIKEGLNDRAQVVTTNLATVSQGAKLRTNSQ